MSHLKERKEQICLNCNAAIYGKYCHVCGQENIEPKETVWHLVTHFIFDLIHFDGKFFSTLKYLLFKPGFLPAEHLRGKRADYLHPIRLYIFVSAFFFLIIFSFYKSNSRSIDSISLIQKMDSLQNQEATLKNNLLKTTDSTDKKEVLNKIKNIESKLKILNLDTSYNNLESINEADIDSIKTNISLLDPFIKKINGTKKDKEELLEIATHLIPKALFIVLPFYALFLLILYGRNKNQYYVNHLIFSVYLFSFTFLVN